MTHNIPKKLNSCGKIVFASWLRHLSNKVVINLNMTPSILSKLTKFPDASSLKRVYKLLKIQKRAEIRRMALWKGPENVTNNA